MTNLKETLLETKRDQLLKELPPKDVAIFRFVEHLLKLEQVPRGDSEPKLSITWNYGRTTEEIIEAALNGETHLLPIPQKREYKVFGWSTSYTLDRKVRNQFASFDDYRAAYPSKGSIDIRILHLSLPFDSLLFVANLSSFKGMEEDWAIAFDKEPYPIKVRDHHDFLYTNPAFKAKESSRV